MDNIFGAVMLFFSNLYASNVLGAQTQTIPPNETLEIIQPIKTQTRFEEKFATSSAIISKITVYKDDPETEAGVDSVLDEGEDGKKTTTTKITFYNGEEYNREVIDVRTIQPKD